MADLSEPKSAIKKKMKDPEFRREWVEKSRRAALGMRNRHKFTREEQSKGGKKSIGRDVYQYHAKEREIIKSLQTNENRVFPSYIIDAFEFEGNVLTIIEVKINSGKLSDEQKEFAELLEKIKNIRFKIIHSTL